MKNFLLIFLIFSFKALAHPVIYQGGFAVSSLNMPDMNNNSVTYSFTSRWALGVEHWRFVKDSKSYDEGFLKINHLLWRHNGDDSQANIYLHGGAGTSVMGGVEGDWESRVLYSSLKYLEFENLAMTQGRIGLSPRLADFNELQTWVMLQARHVRGGDESIQLTPLIRFFITIYFGKWVHPLGVSGS